MAPVVHRYSLDHVAKMLAEAVHENWHALSTAEKDRYRDQAFAVDAYLAEIYEFGAMEGGFADDFPKVAAA